MTLPPIVIRYKRSALVPLFALCAFMFLGMTYMIFFSGAAQVDLLLYVSYFTGILAIGLVVFLTVKRVRDPQPVLIFLSDGLRLPGKKDLFIPWDSITEWKIRTYKSTNRLVIRTSRGKTSISINWLELPTKEIKWLIESYIRQPGPNGYLR